MAKDTEKTEELREEAAEKWKAYVRKEINSYLDVFLDVASEGTIGVKYDFAPEGVQEDGVITNYNEKEAHGVQIILNLNFEKPLFFTDEEGFIK